MWYITRQFYIVKYFEYYTHFMSHSLISNVLRLLMFRRNMNVSQLARETHLPQQTLQRLVSGASANPHEKTLIALTHFFGLSVEELKGEKELPSHVGKDIIKRPHPDIKQIPVIDWENIELFLENLTKIEIKDFVLGDPKLPDDIFALSMRDTSMEPYIPKDSTLIFSPTISAKDRTFVLAKIGQNTTAIFRQLLIDGDQQYLKSMNPDLSSFPMRILGKKDKLLGTLVEYRYCY